MGVGRRGAGATREARGRVWGPRARAGVLTGAAHVVAAAASGGQGLVAGTAERYWRVAVVCVHAVAPGGCPTLGGREARSIRFDAVPMCAGVGLPLAPRLLVQCKCPALGGDLFYVV